MRIKMKIHQNSENVYNLHIFFGARQDICRSQLVLKELIGLLDDFSQKKISKCLFLSNYFCIFTSKCLYKQFLIVISDNSIHFGLKTLCVEKLMLID